MFYKILNQPLKSRLKLPDFKNTKNNFSLFKTFLKVIPLFKNTKKKYFYKTYTFQLIKNT